MKLMTSAAALLLAAGLSAGPANAADWTNVGLSGQFNSQYAVAYDSGTDTYSYVLQSDINDDGTFKDTGACSVVGVTCAWTPKATAETQVGGSPAWGTDGIYVPSRTVSDAKTGGTRTAGPNGVTFSNGSASTSVEAAGISTPYLTVDGINVGGTLVGHASHLTSLQDQADANTTGVAINAGAISANAAGIIANATNIATNATDIATNTATLGTHWTAITGLQSAAVDHEIRIGDLENITSGHTAQIGNLQVQADANTNAIGVNAAAILTNAGDIAANSGRLDDHEDRIGVNEGDIAALEGWKAGLSGDTDGGSIEVTSAGGSSTEVSGAGLVYKDGKGGSISIGGDPTLTVTDGSGSTTQIVNGAVTASDSITSNGTLTVKGNALFGSGADKTTVSGGDVTATGTVSANHVAANTVSAGSVGANYVYADTLATAGYGNVGAALTSHGAAISDLYGLYGSQQAQIGHLNQRMDKAYAGIAMASAFHSPQVDPGKTFGAAISYANFEGFNAFSTNVKWRISDHFAIVGGGSFADSGAAAGMVAGEVQW